MPLVSLRAALKVLFFSSSLRTRDRRYELSCSSLWLSAKSSS